MSSQVYRVTNTADELYSLLAPLCVGRRYEVLGIVAKKFAADIVSRSDLSYSEKRARLNDISQMFSVPVVVLLGVAEVINL